MLASAFASQNLVVLNVGGTKFTTKASTLSRVPGTRLSELVTRGCSEENQFMECEGSIFVDRDGKQFRHILNFLRDGTLPTLSTMQDRQELLCEAKFYRVKDLIEWCSVENIEEARLRHQQTLLLQQYAISVKDTSVHSFQRSISGYNTTFENMVTLITTHAHKNSSPWLSISMREFLRQSPNSSPAWRQAVLRCFCEGLKSVGFCCRCDFDNESIKVDLWNPQISAVNISSTPTASATTSTTQEPQYHEVTLSLPLILDGPMSIPDVSSTASHAGPPSHGPPSLGLGSSQAHVSGLTHQPDWRLLAPNLNMEPSSQNLPTHGVSFSESSLAAHMSLPSQQSMFASHNTTPNSNNNNPNQYSTGLNLTHPDYSRFHQNHHHQRHHS